MKQVNNNEFANRKIITGSSTVIHSIRVDMKLSLEEYVIMDFIYNHNLENSSAITFSDFYRQTGFMPEDVKEFMKALKDKDLIVFDKVAGRIEVNDTWKLHFSTDIKLEALWKILKKGNKQEARLRLPKALKKISFEELQEKLNAYVNHCSKYNIFMKGLNVWLNPNKEHWNDPLVEQKQHPMSRSNNPVSAPIKRTFI